MYHKPLHPTQKVKYEDDNLIVRISVIPNRELISQILSYGRNVEVLAPPQLREEIQKELCDALHWYNAENLK